MRFPAQASQKKSIVAVVAASILVLVVLNAILRSEAWRTDKQQPTKSTESNTNPVESAPHPAYTPPSDAGYVGSDVCAECHRSISDAYRSHPMAHSMAAIEGQPRDVSVADAETKVDGRTRYFQVSSRDGHMAHHERMNDANGDLIYDQAIPMNYVVGSGKRARAYLFQQGRVLFMSPLNWYSQANRWDLAPGYVPDDPRRFDRRVTDECLSCHAGRVAPVGRSLNTYHEPPFYEIAIGCERCHGPGEKHVALRSLGKVIEAGADPIVNPARLDTSRRESICNQCHLQAAVRLPRPGRSDLDFRPGQNIDEIWTYLDIKRPITADGRTHSVNHVQQMRESHCFTGSGDRPGCTSCHDPHKVPTKADRVSFYRSRCLKCHEESSCVETIEHRSQQSDSCIACHMPARQSSNISHVTQTDHRIIRFQAAGASETASDNAGTLTLLANDPHQLNTHERDRSIGLGAWARLTKTGRRPTPELGQFLAQVLRESPDDGLLLIALGTMAQQGHRLNLARDYLERARQIPSAEETATSALLEIYYDASDWDKAMECANRLIEINPREVKAYAIKADAASHLGRPAEGITAAEQAIGLNPSLLPVRRWLITAYRTAGRESEAKAEEALIERIESIQPPGKN